VTWDAGTVKFFVDGVLDSTHTVAWSLTANTEALVFGCDFPGGNEYFNGRMDELAIWTRVLSPTEITDIYDQQSKTGVGVATATAAFTPDVTGTYTVQLTVADGVSVTADAVISAASSKLRELAGLSLHRSFSPLGPTFAGYKIK